MILPIPDNTVVHNYKNKSQNEIENGNKSENEDSCDGEDEDEDDDDDLTMGNAYTHSNSSDGDGDGVNDITRKLFDMMGFRSDNKLDRDTYESINANADANADANAHANADITANANADNDNENYNDEYLPSVKAMNDHAKIFDKFWAKALYETNKEDREAIQYELHGVESRAVPETPEIVQAALDEMEREIDKKVDSISMGCASSAETAAPAAPAAASSKHRDRDRTLVNGHLMAVEKLHSSYVVSPRYRLRFLRHEFFDAKKAAVRYFKCLNLLLAAFGEASLTRPLRIADLTHSEQIILESGKMQVLVGRDRMGRRVFLYLYGSMMEYPWWERQNVELYLIFGVLAEDEETQLHGAVAVVLNDIKEGHSAYEYNTNTEQQMNQNTTNNNTNKNSNNSFFQNGTAPAWESHEKRIFRKVSRHKMGARQIYLEWARAFPIRWSSLHLCIPKDRVYSLLKFIIMGYIPPVYRSMAKVHKGSYLECRYELRQFGIPVEEIPAVSSKRVLTKSKSLARLLNARAAMDAFRSKGHNSETPSTTTKNNTNDRNGDTDETTISTTETTTAAAAVVQVPTEDYFNCPGTDCPESNCMVFGDRFTYKYKANVAFREYLQTKEKGNNHFQPSEEPAGTISTTNTNNDNNNNAKAAVLRLNAQALDQIIDELCSQGTANTANENNTANAVGGAISSVPFLLRSKGAFRFAVYEKETGWYRYIDPIRSEADRIELRKKISQTIRDDRKRAMKSSKTTATHGQSEEGGQQLKPLAPFPSASMFLGNQGISSRSRDVDSTIDSFCGIPRNELVAKRFKGNHC